MQSPMEHGFSLKGGSAAAIKTLMSRALPGWAVLASGTCAFVVLAGSAFAGQHDALITKHASNNGVPESLVRRVIYIESKGNPRVISKGNYGLMQIRLGTAKSMGYGGTAEGLLDADTNMTYAVKYLAIAYRAAGCVEERAIAYYQRGFYKKPVSSCGPRATPAVQVAAKETTPKAKAATKSDTDASLLAAAERINAPFDALQPKVVQVQTIVRPKNLNGSASGTPAQTAQAPSASVQTASAQSAPVQNASLQLAAAPAAAAVAVAAAPAESKSSDVQLPQSPPLPHPARRPEVAAVQTVAKAPDAEQAWPPAVTPEQPAVAILPMPKPRPAKAPKALARLDVTGQDVSRQDVDVAPTEVSAAEREPQLSSQVSAQVSAQASAEVPSQASAQASSEMQMAVPLPQPRPEADAEPTQESKQTSKRAHRRWHRHSYSQRTKKPETPALIAFLQKLTTPAKPARKRH